MLYSVEVASAVRMESFPEPGEWACFARREWFVGEWAPVERDGVGLRVTLTSSDEREVLKSIGEALDWRGGDGFNVWLDGDVVFVDHDADGAPWLRLSPVLRLVRAAG